VTGNSIFLENLEAIKSSPAPTHSSFSRWAAPVLQGYFALTPSLTWIYLSRPPLSWLGSYRRMLIPSSQVRTQSEVGHLNGASAHASQKSPILKYQAPVPAKSLFLSWVWLHEDTSRVVADVVIIYEALHLAISSLSHGACKSQVVVTTAAEYG